MNTPKIRFKGFTDDWEQRKVGDQMYIKSRIGWQALTKQEYLSEGDYYLITGTDIDETTHRVDLKRSYYVSKERYEMDSKIQVKEGDIIVTKDGTIGKVAMVTGLDKPATLNSHLFVLRDMSGKLDNHFLLHILNSHMFNHFVKSTKTGSTLTGLPQKTFVEFAFSCPKYEEQKLLSNYFDRLDHLIALHQRKCCELKKLKQYMANHMFVNQSIKCDRNIAPNHRKLQERTKEMGELESVIEQRLIDQLCGGDSQWTYRKDIRTEEQLWDNFKYILEQNNKAKLNDMPLSDSEFAKIKNDVSHASFYDAGKWQVGENGKVYVHVQRGNETLNLVVMNNEHIAGGTSVYEVINQYQAFKTDEVDDKRDRRFDVTLLINGIPMIHIELKNKDHSYMDGYRQIEKYISEGKFRGLFSNIQMFVVSNAVDTKYFAAARAAELAEGKKFITGWVDNENYPVCDYLDFAKAVLRIPQAHEMIKDLFCFVLIRFMRLKRCGQRPSGVYQAISGIQRVLERR